MEGNLFMCVVTYYSMEFSSIYFGNKACIQSVHPPTNSSLIEFLKFLRVYYFIYEMAIIIVFKILFYVC